MQPSLFFFAARKWQLNCPRLRITVGVRKAMSQLRFAFGVVCPKCKADIGKWCREKSKSVGPHKERRREAARAACGIIRRTAS